MHVEIEKIEKEAKQTGVGRGEWAKKSVWERTNSRIEKVQKREEEM